MSTFKVGDRVKRSAYAVEDKRQYWLSQGGYSQKEQARGWYDEACAKRGTVAEILPGGMGLRILWDGGSESSCLSYMVEVSS